MFLSGPRRRWHPRTGLLDVDYFDVLSCNFKSKRIHLDLSQELFLSGLVDKLFGYENHVVYIGTVYLQVSWPGREA